MTEQFHRVTSPEFAALVGRHIALVDWLAACAWRPEGGQGGLPASGRQWSCSGGPYGSGLPRVAALELPHLLLPH
jgi:hypothetical protein